MMVLRTNRSESALGVYGAEVKNNGSFGTFVPNNRICGLMVVVIDQGIAQSAETG
jgi:hypothetical protein